MLCSQTANDKNYNFLVKKDIDKDAIILQSRSRDTITEAYFCKTLIPEECDNILVVSSDYHIHYRAALIFDYAFNKKYNIIYDGVKTNRMGHKKTLVDQGDSLKLFLKNFSLDVPIEKQINKHNLYKKI